MCFRYHVLRRYWDNNKMCLLTFWKVWEWQHRYSHPLPLPPPPKLYCSTLSKQERRQTKNVLQRNTGTVFSMYRWAWKLMFRATLENLLLLRPDKAECWTRKLQGTQGQSSSASQSSAPMFTKSLCSSLFSFKYCLFVSRCVWKEF